MERTPLQYATPSELFTSLTSTYADTREFYNDILNRPLPASLPRKTTAFVDQVSPERRTYTQIQALNLLDPAVSEVDIIFYPHIMGMKLRGHDYETCESFVSHQSTIRAIGRFALRSDESARRIAGEPDAFLRSDDNNHLVFNEAKHPMSTTRGCPFAKTSRDSLEPAEPFQQFIPWYGKLIIHSIEHYLS